MAGHRRGGRRKLLIGVGVLGGPPWHDALRIRNSDVELTKEAMGSTSIERSRRAINLGFDVDPQERSHVLTLLFVDEADEDGIRTVRSLIERCRLLFASGDRDFNLGSRLPGSDGQYMWPTEERVIDALDV